MTARPAMLRIEAVSSASAVVFSSPVYKATYSGGLKLLIDLIPPDALRGKYQCFTQADQTKLRAAGYDAPFLSVQEGVDRYVRWLFGQV